MAQKKVVPTQGTVTTNTYHEDVSWARPHANVNTHFDTVDEQDEQQVSHPHPNAEKQFLAVLDSIDALYKSKKSIQGYTIQIYAGNFRQDAMAAKSKLTFVQQQGKINLTYQHAQLRYTQPKFHVTLGQYYTKLEAQKDLMAIKKIFSTAILIPERIPL